MTAVLDTPTTAQVPAPRPKFAATVRYRDLTTAQRDTWHAAETTVATLAEAANIDGILAIWRCVAPSLGLRLSIGGELVECGCENCDCDRIYDLAFGAETTSTVGGIQTPICPNCYSDHPPAD